MSTIKISELTLLTRLDANTSNTIFVGVDLPTGDTSKITATTIAKGLYSHNPLNVGNNEILFPDTIGQFSGNSDYYLQVNLQNFTSNGSGDYVVTADEGTDTQNYIDMGITNSAYDPGNPYNGLGTCIEPLSGYLYVQGDSSTPNTGNLIIGSTQPSSEIRFITSGVDDTDINAKITDNGLVFVNSKYITFTDGTTQNTAPATNAYSVATHNLAYNANLYSYSANTYLQSYASSLTNSANAYLQSYTNAANTFIRNNYLANTTGTFGGTLTIAGKANVVGGQVIIANSAYDYTNTALVKIIGSTGGAFQGYPQAGYMLDITGVDGVPSRVVNNSYGANTFPLVGGRKGNGTAASPTAAANNDILFRFGASGYTGTGFAAGGQSRVDFIAAQNYTLANTGSRIEFWNTPLNSNTISKIASFNGESVVFTGAVEPQKGFIFTPRILVGAQTAISLDFATDSVIQGTFTTGGVVITPNNFRYGKVVEVWLTNLAGNGQTITHGLTANNSSTGSTTITVASQRSAHLRYFSIDGDLANTFVSASYT